MSPLPGDPMWHANSSNGVATSVSELLYPCYFTLLLTKCLSGFVNILQITLVVPEWSGLRALFASYPLGPVGHDPNMLQIARFQ